MSADFSPEFQAFGGWIAAAAIQQQDLFNEAVGSDPLQADLDARTLTGERGVLGGVSLLGSFSELDQTWLWGWANPGFGADAAAVAPTERTAMVVPPPLVWKLLTPRVTSPLAVRVTFTVAVI